MTKKRFTIKEVLILDVESIDIICDGGIELPTSTACDLLNELFNENEQVKSTNMELEDYLGRLEERVKTLEEGILDCLFENESLGEFALKMRLVE